MFKSIKKLSITALLFGSVFVGTSTLNSNQASAKSTSWANFDIRTQASSKVTASTINASLKKKGKSAKIRNGNYGKYIMKSSEKYGINPAIMYGMFVWETGWGSSNLFTKHNNVGGISCMKGYSCVSGYSKFPSVAKAFDKKAQILAGNLYVASGRVKFKDVIARYSPYSSNYIANVGSIIEYNLSEKPKTGKLIK